MKQELRQAEIAVDIEMTLASTHTEMLRVINSLPNRGEYTLEDIDHWDWVSDEISFDEFTGIVQSLWYSGGDRIEPVSGPGVWWHTLTEMFDVDLVTQRVGVEGGMKDWLWRHKFLGYRDFISLPLDSSGREKTSLEYDIYIDDNPGMARSIPDSTILYLVDQPYNRDVVECSHVKRVSGPHEAGWHILINLDQTWNIKMQESHENCIGAEDEK